MKVYACLLLFLYISPLILFAQEDAGPMIEKMNKSKGNEKVSLLNDLSVFYRKSDRFIAMDYARKAFKLSAELNYLPGKALAKKNEGVCWFFIGKSDSAKLCYTLALEIYLQINDDKGVSACYNNLGLIAQETGQYNDALQQYQLSIEMDTKRGDIIGCAETMENIASIHLYLGNTQQALQYTNKCIKIYTEHSDMPGMLASYSNRAAVYDYSMKYDLAILDYTKALNMSYELNDKYQIIHNTSNMGVTYYNMGKMDTALSYLNKALSMSDETDDAFNIDNTLKTIAKVYTAQRKYIESNTILFSVLKRNEGIDNERQAAVIMTSIGRNLIELNEIDKAIGYFTKSLEITKRLNTPFELIDNYRNLVYVNAILHDFNAADSLQELFAKTYTKLYSNDSLVKSNKKTALTDGTIALKESSPGNWVIAFLLFVLIVIISIVAFGKGESRGFQHGEKPPKNG